MYYFTTYPPQWSGLLPNYYAIYKLSILRFVYLFVASTIYNHLA